MDPTSPDTTLLSRLLAATEMRHRVHMSNIANSNTPGYKRQVVEFEHLLRDALAEGSSEFGTIQPEVRTDTATSARPDGNNVMLELEMNAMRENRLLYETYTVMLSGQFRLLDTAIKGGT